MISDTDGAQIVLFVFENQPGGPPRQVLEAQQHFPVVCSESRTLNAERGLSLQNLRMH
jgi:hypothetical protein